MKFIDLIRDIDSNIDEEYIQNLKKKFAPNPMMYSIDRLEKFWMYPFKFRLDKFSAYSAAPNYIIKNDILLIMAKRGYVDKILPRSIGFDGKFGCFTFSDMHGFDFLSKEEIYSEDIEIVLSKGRYLVEEF